MTISNIVFILLESYPSINKCKSITIMPVEVIDQPWGIAKGLWGGGGHVYHTCLFNSVPTVTSYFFTI